MKSMGKRRESKEKSRKDIEVSVRDVKRKIFILGVSEKIEEKKGKKVGKVRVEKKKPGR